MGESSGFYKLHPGIQKWIWNQRWTALRDIQERSIEPILSADRDVVISASTAAGKTEAAFLPACSRIVDRPPNGIGVLYISPLKALINDQYRRLQSLCDILNLQVTPWHGDVLQSKKDKQKKKPGGILLITPESLESLLLSNAGWCQQAFKGLCYVIVDEFHAFIGTERGCQLQSLMHRIEFLIQRIIPRIALSATLGDMENIAQYLRPSKKLPCEIIESTSLRSDLKIQLRGYVSQFLDDKEETTVIDEITDDLYRILRGKSHLIFANSRAKTELVASKLAERCERDGVLNEFFPHHGSLSKEFRESLEKRFQETKLPTSAICTMTLELGIDIGSVDSIAQVTAPHSVTSLRQRLGRSGRRGDAAVLRMFIAERELSDKSHLIDRLRMETFQCIAMVNLLLKKWYEPPVSNQYHLSTLVQQTLSVIAQYGGVRANQLWSLLCGTGPFSLIDQTSYGNFLRTLGQKGMITQTQDGQLVLGHKGENLIDHFTFLCAFNTPEEYRLESNGHVLGSLPIDKPLMIDQMIIFAGKKWKVTSVDPKKKLIMLQPAPGGHPPKFDGAAQTVHNIVRQEMLSVYRQGTIPAYLDKVAKEFFEEGIECFNALHLDKSPAIQIGSTIYILPWLGDRITSTQNVLLRKEGLKANSYCGIIEVEGISIKGFHDAIGSILNGPKPSPADLAMEIQDTFVEKHDWMLSKEMRELGYGARFFDIDGAWKWMSVMMKSI